MTTPTELRAAPDRRQGAEVIAEPPWTVGLPRSTGTKNPGYHRLPTNAGALPNTAVGDAVRQLALGLRRRCSVCGCALAAGQPVWHVFDEETPPQLLGDGVYTHPNPGPTHQSCAIYASLVCPLLKYPTARRRWTLRDGRVVPAGRHENPPRGEAALVAFDSYGLAFGTGWLWAYWGLSQRIPYGTWRDTLPLYDAAIVADALHIDTATRLYWTADEQQQLAALSVADARRLEVRRIAAHTRVGGRWYPLSAL